MLPSLCASTIALVLLAVASPAAAQWTRVLDVPVTDVFSVWSNGDTLAAGTDTSAFVSTDAGTSWHHSIRPTAGVTSMQALWIRNGRLYAGTFGQGVFVSDDLGDTWQAFNQGLVGGPLDSQRFITDFQVRGDSIYAATAGAGVYVRNLSSGTWSHFGEVFEPNQASNVNALGLGGTRLMAAAGANGMVFIRDPGDTEWTVSLLGNTGLLPGTQAECAVWNGSGWVVGSSKGVFFSPLGEEPWSFTALGLGPLNNTSIAPRGRDLFGAFDIANAVVIEHSNDDGASWQQLETLPLVFVYKLAMIGSELYSGRADGLWRRSTTDVTGISAGRHGLRFALVGPQPVRGDLRFRFELPTPGTASIELFDIAGRRPDDRVVRSWPAGANEVSWDTRSLAPGIDHARLTALGQQEVVRVIRVQ